MLENLLRSFDGPFTRSLQRVQAGFGLGQVPRDQVPSATALMRSV